MLSKPYYPIFLKSVIRCDTPLDWFGGEFIPLYKGKGDASDCSRSRGVVVENSCTKKYSAFARNRLFHTSNRFVRQGQCGGVPKSGSDFAAHSVRAFIEMASTRRFSAAILLANGISLFDALIRAIVTRPLQTHDTLQKDISA